ncbi:MAG: hypothetical protein PUD20_02815 [bacterium]|nr:hypothetical protein [bacterium]
MSFKEYLKSEISSFFIVVTLVNIATFVLGSIFQPDARFGYDAFLSPLVFGVLSMIPTLITYCSHELSMKQMLVRKILQFFCLEVILIFACFGRKVFEPEYRPTVIAFAVSVLIIDLLVHMICWFLDKKTADQLTHDLQSYQDSVE